MKTLKLLIAFLATTAFTISCSKDDDQSTDNTTYPEENFYQAFLDNSGLNSIGNVISSSNYEGGLRFKPTVDGNMTKIVIKLPADQTDLRITIWDVATQEILRTETITTMTAGVETSQTITPLALTKNKEYTISFNSSDWYQRDNTDSNIPYPVTAGNIAILGYYSNMGVSQTFPSTSHPSATAGDLSFVFQRTQ